ncbi:hypothetical protein C8Q80DRAFT_354435 [Daedaleopsis nitida]|nr:hypothetical protein C8Q80DRAFT_354435 [Daedaleopsis nitida]
MSTSPGPDPSDQGPPSGFNSIFQTPGGPPLILVCIAAGLLLGAFIGVLLMRRMRPGVVVQRVHGGRVPGSQFKLGERPTLLDIHIMPRSEVGMGRGLYGDGLRNGTGGTGPETAEWARVSPFAAMYIPSSEPTKPLPPSRPAAPSSSLRSHVHRVQQALAHLRHSAPRAAHDPHAPSTSSSTDLRQVQLAVAVTMPNPKQPQYARPSPAGTSSSGKASSNPNTHDLHAHNNNDNHAHSSGDDDEMPDCCIGTVVVQYHPPPDEHPTIPDSTPFAPAPPPSGALAPAPAPRVQYWPSQVT